MSPVSGIFLYLVIVILGVPVAVLGLQIFSALRKEMPTTTVSELRKFSFTILIPAHNEEEIIGETLASIKTQVTGDNKILVIADNCSDNTEQIVTGLGVEVISRSSINQRGKGFALGFGIRYINEFEVKPDVLVILDADCTVAKGEIINLAAKSIELNRPVQALYLMHSNKFAGIGQKISEFAWLLKNKIRPLGYKKLYLPCQLLGSGMAFPWSIVSAERFTSANIVEDLELGITYTMEGLPPFFYPVVSIASFFPLDADSEKSQRKRWEHGYLITIAKLVPSLIKSSISNRDFKGAAMTADLLIPPLALLATLLIVINAFCLGYAVVDGDFYPLLFSLLILIVFSVEIIVAWFYFGRDMLGLRHLFYIPFYIVKKLPLYLAVFVKRQVGWVKTSRKGRKTR